MNQILWTAVVTPMLPEGHIDFVSLERVLLQQDRAGNGIVLLGSTGEALNLDVSERRAVVRFAVDLSLQSPILVGVDGLQIAQVKAWLDFCEGQALDGYLMVAPLYARPGQCGQVAWFRQLFDHVTRPCMVYNIPSRTGCHLVPEAMAQLAEHPRFWAVKECSGVGATFQRWRRALPRIALYSGDDGLFWQQVPWGADGLVSVMANPWPVWARAYVLACLAGGHPGPEPSWSHAADVLFAASNPIPVKALLYQLGVIDHPHVRLPLDVADLVGVQALLDADASLRAWSDGERRRQCA